MSTIIRPYRALFASRFQQMLQYRGAAIAGFATQCWWGGLKAMIFAAFYTGSTNSAPLTLSQSITYTWVSQALLLLIPWLADPDVANAVRTGAVSYDRLRPVDFYLLWFSRAAGWISARVLPRAAFMLAFAAMALPLVGLSAWSWQPPVSVAAGVLFAVSMVLAVLLSSAMVMILNIIVAATLNARGVNSLIGGPAIVLTGNLLPLSLFPDALNTLLLCQPFAGLVDIPLRIYLGVLDGAAAWGGLGLQVLWIAVFVALGRAALARVARTLEMQGG